VCVDAGDVTRVNAAGPWFRSKSGYPVRKVNGLYQSLHAFIVGVAPKGYHIDHIDSNVLNATRANLQIITVAENMEKRRTHRPKHPGLPRGVSPRPRKNGSTAFVARFGKVHLGTFATAQQASDAWTAAAKASGRRGF
jgi:hypothetical protein